MRKIFTLPATALTLGMLASAGCSEQAPELTTAPEVSHLAPAAPSFQRDVTQVSFGNLISALVNIDAKIVALNNVLNNTDLDIEDVTVNVVNVDDVIVTLKDNQISLLNVKIQDVNVDVDLQDITVIIQDVVDIGDVNILAIDVNVATGDITLFTVSDTMVSDFDLNTLDL